MKNKTLLFSLFVLSSIVLFGQENKTAKNIKYSNITEYGCIGVNPADKFFLEATIINGFSLNQKHIFGLGTGLVFRFHVEHSFYVYPFTLFFLNYRYYFLTNKEFSPHINVAIGGFPTNFHNNVYTNFYSALTVGFRAKYFSFSSGISFLVTQGVLSGLFPFKESVGFTMKWGFTL